MFDKKKHYGKRIHPLKVVSFIALGALFIFATGMIVMLLWNSILPRVTGFKAINFWEALGLFLLFRILFGGMGRLFGFGKTRSRHRRRWKEKWSGMNEEDKAEFKRKWKERCNRRNN